MKSQSGWGIQQNKRYNITAKRARNFEEKIPQKMQPGKELAPHGRDHPCSRTLSR